MNEKPRWGFTEIIMVYLGIIISGIIISFLSSRIPQLAEGFGMGEVGYFLFAFLVQFVVTVGLVYILAVLRVHGSWSELGIRRTHLRNYLVYGIWGGILLIFIVLLLGVLLKQFQPELPPQYYETMLRSAAKLPVFLLIFLVGAVLAPISEEIFYRGMVYPVFRGHLGPLWGAITAGLVFGLAHWDLWRAIPLSIGGAILCYIYEKTDSIWVSSLAHGVWNGVMSLFVYLSLLNGWV